MPSTSRSGETCVNGSCLCRSVRFEIALPTLFCAHCHCSMCQRNHGAGFVTWTAVPRRQFRVTTGEAGLMRYESSEHGTRSFCGRCGSSLFCESTHHPDKIDIALANLEDSIDRVPQMHVYYDDRAGWVSIEDRLPRLGGKTGLEPLKDSP
jgi:hypothetical protein